MVTAAAAWPLANNSAEAHSTTGTATSNPSQGSRKGAIPPSAWKPRPSSSGRPESSKRCDRAGRSRIMTRRDGTVRQNSQGRIPRPTTTRSMSRCFSR